MSETKRVRAFDHTADLGIEAWGASLAELFEAAAEGLLEVIADTGRIRPREAREVEAFGDDLEDLLVAWLSEVLYVHEAEGLLLCEARVNSLDRDRFVVRGEVRGEAYDPGRHDVHTALKAVTYHGLEVTEAEGGGFRARVIFDV